MNLFGFEAGVTAGPRNVDMISLYLGGRMTAPITLCIGAGMGMATIIERV